MWAGVSDGNGAIVRQSFNLGTGKLGPAITAKLDKIRFRPTDSVKLSISANCSGFFQLYCDGSKNFDFEKDMYRYSYSENKTTDFILAGPECTSRADIYLESKSEYTNATYYNLVLVFRDGLFQTCDYGQTIYVDEQKPEVNGFSPNIETSAELAPEVTVLFNEEIGYADNSSLKLYPADGNVKLLRISGKTVYFSVTGLESLTPYRATISGIKDIAGNVMVPDSTNSFTTKYSGSSKFIVYDKNIGSSYTSYCGFENKELNLIAQYGGQEVSGVKFTSSNQDYVSISDTGKKTVLTRNLENVDENITITAEYMGEKAYFVVRIKPWYPLTKASEFGQGGIIDQNLNGRFRLENNIDFGGSEENAISPIGYYLDGNPFDEDNKPFTGIFDGNRNKNFKLSNIILKASEPIVLNGGGINAGIFAYNKGTITNLDVNMATFEVSSKGTVGIICATNEGVVSKCKVIDLEITASSYAGGIAGYNFGVYDDGELIGGIISECEVTGESNINAAYGYSGGLAGLMKGGKIEGSSSSCNISSVWNSVGGLIGDLVDAEVINCHSTGKVIGSKDVGGLIGTMSGGIISGIQATSLKPAKYSFSLGKVMGNENVGGLVGNVSSGTISYCYSGSTIEIKSAGSDKCIGGLIGILIDSSVKQCFSSGVVLKDNSSTENVGGLIGYCTKGKILKSFHENGAVGGKTCVGGLIGFMNNKGSESEVITSYASDCEIKGQNNVGGLIGRFNESADSTVKVDQCFANTIVTGNVENTGGLIGYLRYAEVTNCYSRGKVDGYLYSGGLVGVFNSNSGDTIISKCYTQTDLVFHVTAQSGGLVGRFVNSDFRIDSSFHSYSNGTNLGTCVPENDLKLKTTYINSSDPNLSWDISDSNLQTTWLIDKKALKAVNGGFPYLREIPPK